MQKTLKSHLSVSTLSSSISTLLPQHLAKLPQKYRRRSPNDNSQESKQTISPTILQRLIHIRREKRKPKSSQRPQKRTCCKGTGRKTRICIDHIGLDALESNDSTSTKQHSADIRRDPMAMFLRCPAIDEQTTRNEKGTDEEEWNAELWLSDAIVASFETAVDSVVEGCADLGTEPEA